VFSTTHLFVLPKGFTQLGLFFAQAADTDLDLVDLLQSIDFEKFNDSGVINQLFVLLGLFGLLVMVFGLIVPRVVRFLFFQFLPEELQEAYQQIIVPYQRWIIISLLLSIGDIILLLIPNKAIWLSISEFFVGAGIAINICFLAFALFNKFFGSYLLDLAIRGQGNANSELLAFIKFIANALIILIVIFIFAESHDLNLTGLIASIGIGGIAIAFASQKVLEQILWTIMLYLDRPFVVDDYIYLQDGTFGRVEAIGWRSSKIRLSGKGTLMVIPNSMLTQMSIENLSGAQKIITLLYILFERNIPEQEKALVRQIILDSTKDIYGIDHRLTEVKFRDIGDAQSGKVQAQVTFFILGSGSLALEIRTQLLDAAQRNISKRLKDYGIGFKIDEKPINVDSPMNI